MSVFDFLSMVYVVSFVAGFGVMFGFAAAISVGQLAERLIRLVARFFARLG